MEAAPPVRSSLFGVLLQVGRLSVLLAQNRVHLYSFLLLKISIFRNWVSGLAQEARGSSSTQANLPPGVSTCLLGQALQAGWSLLWIPAWLLLYGPRLMWAAGLGCARTLGLGLQRLGASKQLCMTVATWRDLLLSCLHSLMLVALLLLLLTWRLAQKAHRFSLGWMPCQSRMVLEPLMLVRHLYWWVEHTTTLASWHLVYLITWTACLASHLLQAAFEHTAQLAQSQEAEPLEASGPLPESPLPESSTPKAGPIPPEPGTPRE
ncbi:transmembrane protein 270 [Castor canadensis]|uniref:Transmembrane protein 270 n=2 Tax=Castor canadensis TaxID=51338 RepID=A0AC58MPR6_CASCN